MSPISNPEPCPFIIQEGDFIFCTRYSDRPELCKKHELPFRFCPVGLEKLNLREILRISQRIDAGWQKIKFMQQSNKER